MSSRSRCDVDISMPMSHNLDKGRIVLQILSCVLVDLNSRSYCDIGLLVPISHNLDKRRILSFSRFYLVYCITCNTVIISVSDNPYYKFSNITKYHVYHYTTCMGESDRYRVQFYA